MTHTCTIKNALELINKPHSYIMELVNNGTIKPYNNDPNDLHFDLADIDVLAAHLEHDEAREKQKVALKDRGTCGRETVYDLKSAAKRIDIQKTLLKELAHQGIIISHKSTKNHLRFYEADLEEFAARQNLNVAINEKNSEITPEENMIDEMFAATFRHRKAKKEDHK